MITSDKNRLATHSNLWASSTGECHNLDISDAAI
jgi:hypothetical protein